MPPVAIGPSVQRALIFGVGFVVGMVLTDLLWTFGWLK